MSSNSYYTGDEFNSPRRTGTDSSHYSCSNLPEDDPARYIRAADARRQVAEAPDKRPRIKSQTSKRDRLAEYPANFVNREKLALQAKKPWTEYPVLAQGSWDPNTGKLAAGGARGIYNRSDRSEFDIAYHDPTKRTEYKDGQGGYKGEFSLASYRPKRT
ncbi:hypothetical protein V8F06_014663 [Rhypophila decipiens]